jgi:hypothetical protein
MPSFKPMAVTKLSKFSESLCQTEQPRDTAATAENDKDSLMESSVPTMAQNIRYREPLGQLGSPVS